MWQVFERLRLEAFPFVELLQSPTACGQLFDPEPPRTYSIASEPPRSLVGTSAFELTVRLHAHDNREGTASSFLCRAQGSDVAVPFAIQKSAAFGPLPPASTPVIAFAAGSGVGPMLSLFAQRFREGAKRNWLVLSLSRIEDFQFAKEWHSAVSRGYLRLDVVFTRQGVQLRHTPSEGFTFTAGNNRHIQDLVRDPHVSHDMHRWLTG
jgi:sulfite reductase alpha subunit-like flavoprotein